MNSIYLRDSLVAVLFSLAMAVPFQAQADEAELLFWKTVTASDTIEMYQSYLETYPEGIFRPLAEIKLRDIEGERLQTETAAIEACDRMAGHRLDETLPVAPTSLRDLQSHAQKALQVCKDAVEASNEPRHTFNLARSYLALGNEEKAVEYYQQAADAGHLRAKYRIARMYEAALYGSAQDWAKARRLYGELVESGHTPAILKLATLDYLGEAIPQPNYRSARVLFERALQSGLHPDANYWLGLIYGRGQGVQTDLRKAVTYLRAVRRDLPNYNREEVFSLILFYTFGVTEQEAAQSRKFNSIEELLASADAAPDQFLTAASYVETPKEAELVLELGADALTEFHQHIAFIVVGGNDTITPMNIDVLANNFARLAEHFGEFALNRYNRFPELEPTVPKERLENTVKALQELSREFDIELRKGQDHIDRAKTYSKNARIADCIKVLENGLTSQRHRVVLRNACDFPVDVAVEKKIRLSGGGIKHTVGRGRVLPFSESIRDSVPFDRVQYENAEWSYKVCALPHAYGGFISSPNTENYRSVRCKSLQSFELIADYESNLVRLTKTIVDSHPRSISSPKKVKTVRVDRSYTPERPVRPVRPVRPERPVRQRTGTTLPDTKEWKAIVMSQDGAYVFRVGDSEESARRAALEWCNENIASGACDNTTVSVEEDWSVVSYICRSGSRMEPFVAASRHDYYTARINASAKMKRSGYTIENDCELVHRHDGG